jgi:hypothetical protein
VAGVIETGAGVVAGAGEAVEEATVGGDETVPGAEVLAGAGAVVVEGVLAVAAGGAAVGKITEPGAGGIPPVVTVGR